MHGVRLNRKTIISFGLVTTFLLAAIAFPILNSNSIVNSEQAYSISSSQDNSSKQNTQFPLAENEKEEESRTEKDQNFSFEFVAGQFEYFLLEFEQPGTRIVCYYDSVISTDVPLYLYKRTLLI